MYRVLIVDDEPRILKGIRKTFEWEEHDFEVIGEVSNPAVAYEIICKHKPHAVFTDICMPIMSGIELMKKVREAELDVEFIVISGFSDFVYARESIEFGAFGYLLKPLNRKEANDILKKLEIHLKRKYTSFKREIYYSISYNMDYMELLHKIGFMCTKNKYLCAIDNKNLFHLLFKKNIPDTDIFSIDIGHDKYFYLINFNADEELYGKLVCDYPDYIAGISTSGLEPSDMSRLLKEANTVFLSSVFYRQANIGYYSKTDRSEINCIIERIIDVINAGDQNSLVEMIDITPKVCIDKNLYLDNLCFIYNTVISYINFNNSDRLSSIGIPYMQPEQVSLNFESIDRFTCFLKEVVNLLIGENEDGNEGIRDDNFTKLLDYVNDTFCEDITLRDVADKFFLNYSYTCTLFKKNTGSNFLEYLTDLRMKKAADLIKKGRVNLTEIHSMVGFNDYYYFNKVFKKYYNMTPNQYKASS